MYLSAAERSALLYVLIFTEDKEEFKKAYSMLTSQRALDGSGTWYWIQKLKRIK